MTRLRKEEAEINTGLRINSLSPFLCAEDFNASSLASLRGW